MVGAVRKPPKKITAEDAKDAEENLVAQARRAEAALWPRRQATPPVGYCKKIVIASEFLRAWRSLRLPRRAYTLLAMTTI